MCTRECARDHSLSYNSSARLWHVDNGTVIQVISHTDHISCVTFSSDSQFIATGSADTSLKVWEANSGKLTQVCIGCNVDERLLRT